MVTNGGVPAALSTSVWLLAVVLGGCGSPTKTAGSPGDGGADAPVAPLTAGEACNQLVAAAAQLDARCRGGALASWQAYESGQIACAAYDRHVAEGLVEYRPQGWAACLHQYALPCDQAQPYPCQFEVLFGKVADGQPCEDTDVCGPVSGCINLAGGACGGTCVRAAVENEACGFYCGGTTSCLDVNICATNLTCAGGICVKAKALGAACGGAETIACAFPLTCDVDPADPTAAGVCVRAQAGGACQGDLGCIPSEFCLAGTCRPRRLAGESCGDAVASCSPWTVCDVGASGVCQPAGEINEACAPPLVAVPTFLTCTTGLCDGVSCVPTAAVGSSCASAPCAQGSTCDATSMTCLACSP